MRIALALFVALHGVAHLVGFLVPWRLIRDAETPYTTRVLGGRVDLGDGGIRFLGLLWLATAVAFLVAAAGLWRDTGWWVPVTVAVSLVSLGLSLLQLPAPRVGVPVNLAVLAAVLAGTRFGWL